MGQDLSSEPVGLKYRSMLDVTREAIQYIDDRRKGLVKSLKTPWKKFNAISLGGIEWHTITTIAGLSGSGKTAIVNELETGLVDLNPNEKLSILSFNFEMLARNLVVRKLSKETNKTTGQLLSAKAGEEVTDSEYTALIEHARKLSKYPIFYVDNAGTVDQIKKTILSFCLKLQDDKKNVGADPEHGVVVFLDHVLLVNGKSGEMERQILFDLMVLFNTLKKSLKVSFIILSQLNRDIEDSERIQTPELQFPRKKDIFGGDSMYQFSDIVMVTHRPEMLGITKYGVGKWPTEGLLYWHYLKVREGEPTVAKMINNLKHNQVIDAP